MISQDQNIMSPNSMASLQMRQLPKRGRISCILGLLAVGGLLVTSRLSHVWLPLDVLSHFTIHFAILIAAFVIGYFIPFERTLTAIVIALVGFIGIGAYAHHLSGNPTPISSLPPGAKQLRLMTFNTSVINTDTDAIAAEVRRLNPDVAVLMEFSSRKRVVLDHLRVLYPHSAGCVPGRHCHFAVLSKVPISASKVREGWHGPLMVRATLGGDFPGLDIIGVHFPRAPHIEAQFKQLAVLLDYLDQIPGKLVLMGDFNATPFSELLSTFSDRTQMDRLTSIPTWPAVGELPQLAIDHIFVSRDIQPLEKARIGSRSGSDHYPVAVTIAVPSTSAGVDQLFRDARFF